MRQNNGKTEMMGSMIEFNFWHRVESNDGTVAEYRERSSKRANESSCLVDAWLRTVGEKVATAEEANRVLKIEQRLDETREYIADEELVETDLAERCYHTAEHCQDEEPVVWFGLSVEQQQQQQQVSIMMRSQRWRDCSPYLRELRQKKSNG